MDKKLQKNLLILAVSIINLILLVAVVVFLAAPDKSSKNKILPPVVVRTPAKSLAWQKIKTISLASNAARTLAVKPDGTLLVADDNGITLYNMQGKRCGLIALPGGITALTADKTTIYAALPRQIIKIVDKKIIKWPKFNSRSIITAITLSPIRTAGVPPAKTAPGPQASRLQTNTGTASVPPAKTAPGPQASRLQTNTGTAGVPPAKTNNSGTAGVPPAKTNNSGTAAPPPARLFIADAGNRKVYCYTVDGKKLWEIAGYQDEKFIVPSPYFDLAADGNGGVWVVNPGRHRVENYTAEGKFKAFWQPIPAKTMLGCCNPAYLGILSGDRFVTLEKGLIRSRLFAPSGKVINTVVPEADFAQDSFEYDLTILPDDKVAILDRRKTEINIYVQKHKR